MSIADEYKRPPIGYIHPDVVRAAKAMHKGGWRVTSVLRPGSPNHGAGAALDTAPLALTQGGFGLCTAQVVLNFLTEKAPRAEGGWVCVSEFDHVHVQLASRNAIGFNSPRGTLLFEPDPSIKEGRGLDTTGLRPLPMSIIKRQLAGATGDDSQ